jgi:tetratricopeptide (TPR) repeat protein
MFSAGPAVHHARAAGAPPTEAASTPAQRAKQHYLRGEAYFKTKNFSEAMDEYQKGYLEKPDPVFIFNIAQCQRLLGNSAAAVDFYQRYLREAPDGPGRPVAEKEIAELRGPAPAEPVAPADQAAPPPIAAVPPSPAAAVAAPPSAPAAAPAPEPAPAPLPAPPAPAASAPVYVAAQGQPAEPPIYKQWYFWTAVAALVVSTVIVASVTSSNRPNCDVGRVCK